MNYEHYTLLISIIVYCLAGYIIIYNTKNLFNPFLLVTIFWILSISNYVFNLAVPDYEAYYKVTFKTANFILINTLTYLAIAFLFRDQRENHNTKHDEIPLILNPTSVFLILTALVSMCGIMLLQKNGWRAPVVILNEAYKAGKGLHYSDLDIPFFTPLSFGLQHFMSVFLACDWVLSKKSLADHFKGNFLLYTLLALVTAVILLSGRRNPVFFLLAIYVTAYCINNRINSKSLLKLLFAGLAFAYVISISFEYRLGGDRNRIYSGLQHQIDTPILGPIINQVVKYSSPIVPNINSFIIRFDRERYYGSIFISDFLPDAMINPFFKVPPKPIETMKKELRLPFFGNTFRTYYSDLYPDFGFFGTIFVANLILIISVIIHNRVNLSPDYLFLYLLLVPAILFMPFLNKFNGLTTLSPILIYFLIRNRQKPAISS